MRHLHYLLWILIATGLASCSSGKMYVSNVGYQSIRTSFAQPKEIPTDAKIATEYFIDQHGSVLVIVYNLTNEIISIDQTKSFLIDTNGQSLSYFDPAVYTSTTGGYNSQTNSTSFNLGAISSIFGINNALGTLLNATTIGSANTVGYFQSNTVSTKDEPIVNVGPKGRIAMSKQFQITGIGKKSLGLSTTKFKDLPFNQSPLKFSSCISYKIGEQDENQKIITDFYVNASIVEPVTKNKVGNSFRKIYDLKSDALAEPAFYFVINTNLPTKQQENSYGDLINTDMIFDSYVHGSLIDYQ